MKAIYAEKTKQEIITYKDQPADKYIYGFHKTNSLKTIDYNVWLSF